MAGLKGHTKTAAFLVEKGADLEIKNKVASHGSGIEIYERDGGSRVKWEE